MKKFALLLFPIFLMAIEVKTISATTDLPGVGTGSITEICINGYSHYVITGSTTANGLSQRLIMDKDNKLIAVKCN